MQLYLKKSLPSSQKQAFQGAKSFIYCLLPLLIFSIILSSVLLYSERESLFRAANASILETNKQYILSLFGAVMTYFISIKYHKKCSYTQTTPIRMTNSIKINESPQQIQKLVTQQLVDKPKKIYCKNCFILCDYRTKHCKKCRVCVQRYDHHCFWIGNCVGRHNHRPFYYFLFWQTLNNTFVFYSMYHLEILIQKQQFYIMYNLRNTFLCLYLVFIGFTTFTGYLLLYHTVIISSGMTTWQHMRRSKISYLNYLPTGYMPFSKGLIQNWIFFYKQPIRADKKQIELQHDHLLPTFTQSKKIKPVCNLVDNQYYSCC